MFVTNCRLTAPAQQARSFLVIWSKKVSKSRNPFTVRLLLSSASYL